MRIIRLAWQLLSVLTGDRATAALIEKLYQQRYLDLLVGANHEHHFSEASHRRHPQAGWSTGFKQPAGDE